MEGLRMEWVDSNTQMIQKLKKPLVNIKWINQDIVNALDP